MDSDVTVPVAVATKRFASGCPTPDASAVGSIALSPTDPTEPEPGVDVGVGAGVAVGAGVGLAVGAGDGVGAGVEVGPAAEAAYIEVTCGQPAPGLNVACSVDTVRVSVRSGFAIAAFTR